ACDSYHEHLTSIPTRRSSDLHEVLATWNTRLKTGEKSAPALHKAMGDVLATQRSRLAIPRRHDGIIYDIWSMQPRFQARAGRKPDRKSTRLNSSHVKISYAVF